MGLNEPITYGLNIMGMDPKGGPKPRDVLNGFFSSTDLGAKLTAAGSYYDGKKSESSAVTQLEGDKTPLPKCEPADNCGWECQVRQGVRRPRRPWASS